MKASDDARRHAGAPLRNRAPIVDVLRRVLPPRGLVLEVASGTGQHAAYFASELPHLGFQPSDADAEMLASISAWCTGLGNVRAPIVLDVTRHPWPIAHAEAVLCINMLHISPWDACPALMNGAAAVLPPGGVLYLYGPYRIGGAHTAPSNQAFEERLRGENAAWGVRDLEAVVAEAERRGLRLDERVAMPANNQSLVFRRG